MGANKFVAIVLALVSSLLILGAQSYPAKHSGKHSDSRAINSEAQTQPALAEVMENTSPTVQFKEGRVNNFATRTAVAGVETLRRYLVMIL